MYLEAKNLKKGGIYHIRNNYAEHLDDLWWNNSKLISIDKEWGGEVTMLTFLSENGKEIVIDSDFVSKTSSERDVNYQIIEKKEIPNNWEK